MQRSLTRRNHTIYLRDGFIRIMSRMFLVSYQVCREKGDVFLAKRRDELEARVLAAQLREGMTTSNGPDLQTGFGGGRRVDLTESHDDRLAEEAIFGLHGDQQCGDGCFGP